jgi:hypothetical protein
VSTRSACVNMKAPSVDAQGNTSCAYSPARRRTPLSSCDATATQSNPKTECPVGPKFGMDRPDRACQSNSSSFGRPQNSLLWGFGGILQVIGTPSDRACLEYVLAVCGTKREASSDLEGRRFPIEINCAHIFVRLQIKVDRAR